MPTKQITNPGGLYGLTADTDPWFVEVVNNSGGTLLPGDVVCFTTDTTGVLVTTTTTANDLTVFGVVGPQDAVSASLVTAASGDTYAAGAVMPVIVRGPARINIGANTVAAGALLTTFTTVKQAQANAGATVGMVIGISLESQAAKDANNTIRAMIQKM